jgi:hypothetical protein
MKKILSLVLVFSLLSISSFAAPLISISKKNGGVNGYYSITERHDSDGSSLNCQDPGNSSCVFDIEPTVEGISQTTYDVYLLIGLAETEINNGNTSGTIIHAGEIEIVFNGTPSNYTIDITPLP